MIETGLPSQERGLHLIREGATPVTALIAIVFIVLAVLVDTAFNLPIKLPGHRAFPGALALLLFAGTFAPVVLLACAAVVPAALAVLGVSSIGMLIAWLGTAVVLLGIERTRLARTLLAFVVLGILFGLLRYLTLRAGWHHASPITRLAGHLCFGGLGGLLAFAGSRLLARKEAR